jgi:AcrR family transcriptional regulator
MPDLERDAAGAVNVIVIPNTSVQEEPKATGFAGTGRAGRKRDERIDDRVRAAALVDLAQHGVSGFSIARVARATNVARNSIYLRWQDASELIVDALDRGVEWPAVVDGGSYAQDLRQLIEEMCDVVTRPATRALLRVASEPGGSTAMPEAYRSRVVEHGLRQGQAVFDRARARGELRPLLRSNLLFGHLLGALILSETIDPGALQRSREARREMYEHFLLLTAAPARR